MNMEKFITAIVSAFLFLHQVHLVFQLIGVDVWDLGFLVFCFCFFFSFLNLPSIALLIPAPDMKETNHTGVYNQTSKVVY